MNANTAGSCIISPIATASPANQSTHIWLPITINPVNKIIRVPWRDMWDLSTFGTKGRGNEVLNENDRSIRKLGE
jgi:hypothetical protein